MTDKNGMNLVIEAFRTYLKSIESFQSGGKVDIPSDSLKKLEREIFSEENPEIQSSVNPDYKSQSFSTLIESIKKVEFTQGVIPYTVVTKLIYRETQFNRELYDTLEDTMEADWQVYLQNNTNIPSETTRIFLKIKEHVGLSIIQRNHINDRLNDQLNETLDKLNESKKGFEILSEELDNIEKEVQKKSDQIVINFITILGIFAAIMMGTVGAFQGFTSMFSNAKDIPIGSILMISSIGASVLSLIMFLLLYSISKLTTFKFSNCNCEKKRKRKSLVARINASILGLTNDEPESNCNCSLFNKYPTILLINYVFYYIAITGFSFMYLDFREYFEHNIWKQLFCIFVMYLFFSLLLLFVHRYILDKNSNTPFFKKIKNDLKSLKKNIV